MRPALPRFLVLAFVVVSAEWEISLAQNKPALEPTTTTDLKPRRVTAGQSGHKRDYVQEYHRVAMLSLFVEARRSRESMAPIAMIFQAGT